jgi:predicted DNA-binding transcriptional regulator YafY
VYGEPGHEGGYALVEGYRTRLTGLHEDEAQALTLAGLPGPAADLGLGSVLAVAQLKFDAALPPSLRSRAGRIRERFHLDAPGWYREAEPVPHLTAVAAAVWDQRVLRVRYRRWADPREVERVLHPLGVVLKAGNWYLIAANGGSEGSGANWGSAGNAADAMGGENGSGEVAEGDGAIRTYRVSQILELTEQSGTFERPADFELAEHWRTSLADFDTRRFAGTATVRLSPEAVHRMTDLYEAAVLKSVAETASEPDGEGWVTAVIPIEAGRHALGEVFKLGWGIEVLAPERLREQVAATARQLARLHGIG